MADNLRRESIVYNNALILLEKYRGYEITNKMTDAEMINNINQNGYVSIYTKEDTHIVIFSYDNEFCTKLAKLLAIINNIKKITKSDKCNIIFVSMGKINKTTMSELEKINCEYYNYTLFAIEHPLSSQYNPHRIISDDEVKELMERLNLSKISELGQRICKDDPIMVWIGGKPGNIIEINNLSENTCNAYIYRYVIDKLVPFNNKKSTKKILKNK